MCLTFYQRCPTLPSGDASAGLLPRDNFVLRVRPEACVSAICKIRKNKPYLKSIQHIIKCVTLDKLFQRLVQNKVHEVRNAEGDDSTDSARNGQLYAASADRSVCFRVLVTELH